MYFVHATALRLVYLNRALSTQHAAPNSRTAHFTIFTDGDVAVCPPTCDVGTMPVRRTAGTRNCIAQYRQLTTVPRTSSASVRILRHRRLGQIT